MTTVPMTDALCVAVEVLERLGVGERVQVFACAGNVSIRLPRDGGGYTERVELLDRIGAALLPEHSREEVCGEDGVRIVSWDGRVDGMRWHVYGQVTSEGGEDA